MLLQQIEEQKRQKEEQKRRRLQEEMEEEDRIKREIEVMNARERDEVDGKKNKHMEYRRMLDQQNDDRQQHKQQPKSEPQSKNSTINRQQQKEVPPEFQDLANSVHEQQKKKVNFEQFPTNYPNIPQGTEMFKNAEFKGTNTQRLNEIQLKFQNEVSGLKSEISHKHGEILSLVQQLKDAQDQIKSKESTDKELERLRAELKARELEERNQQANLQSQLIELMKGYQQQINYMHGGDRPPSKQQRPGSNRSIGNHKDTRSSELKSFEKMLFSGNPKGAPSISNDPSNVMIDFSNPSSKPYVKVTGSSDYPESYKPDLYSKFADQRIQDLNKSASLNAESHMMPLPSANKNKKPPSQYQPKLDTTGELG